MTSKDQHECVFGRTVNMIALPTIKTEKEASKKTSMSLVRWRQEIDLRLKSKVYRKDMPTELILPVRHFD